MTPIHPKKLKHGNCYIFYTTFEHWRPDLAIGIFRVGIDDKNNIKLIIKYSLNLLHDIEVNRNNPEWYAYDTGANTNIFELTESEITNHLILETI